MLTVYGMTHNPGVIPEQPGNPELLHVQAESDLSSRQQGVGAGGWEGHWREPGVAGQIWTSNDIGKRAEGRSAF